MRILAIGDVVGKPGRNAVIALVSALREQNLVDFVVVNGENAAGGSGISPGIVEALLAAGADVITSGDHIFKNRDVLSIIGKEPRLLRPANLSPAAAGTGYGVFQSRSSVAVGVINVMGRIFMNTGSNPFVAVEAALETLKSQARVVLVDVHAEATSEKIALGWFLDGRVSFVFGTHTHVQTADARVLPQGTAYITDLGMSGPHDGVIGRAKERVIAFLRTDMQVRFELAEGDVKVHGALAEVDENVGKARSITAFCWVPGTDVKCVVKGDAREGQP